jgi:DHA1 family multidrug resistance protein-like MFS transporter
MYISSYEYIIDSYGEHAVVALASITLLRYLIAGGMTMVARQMFENIGVHWTLTLLGLIAAVLTPGPFLLRKYGYNLRRKSKYAKSSS